MGKEQRQRRGMFNNIVTIETIIAIIINVHEYLKIFDEKLFHIKSFSAYRLDMSSAITIKFSPFKIILLITVRIEAKKCLKHKPTPPQLTASSENFDKNFSVVRQKLESRKRVFHFVEARNY